MTGVTVNAELLRAVADKIEAEPEHYFQGAFAAIHYTNGEDSYRSGGWKVEHGAHACGTAHCIAGWAMVESGWACILHPYEGDEGRENPWLETWWLDPEGERWLGDGWAVGRELLGFGAPAAGSNWPLESIFGGGWKPREGLTVPQALRAIAGGATYEQVTYGEPWDNGWDPDTDTIIWGEVTPLEEVLAMVGAQ